MTIGEKIISEIAFQDMIRVTDPDPDVAHVYVWRANAEEQLTALVEHYFATEYETLKNYVRAVEALQTRVQELEAQAAQRKDGAK